MEATAGTPGQTGPHTATTAVGEHIHQLLHLAAALTTAAASAAGAGPGSGAGGAGVAAPLGVDLDSLSGAQAIAWAQDLEHLGRFLTALQVQAAGTLARHTRAARFSDAGITKPAALLTTTLKLSTAEAHRRLRLADHFLPTTDPLTTVTTPPPQPVLASAFFSGQLSAEQALLVSGFTDDADHLAHAGTINHDEARELEATLTGYAHHEAPDFLRRIGTHAVNLLDPDGQQPSDGELLARQGIFFRHPRRGLVHFDGHMTVPQYETLMSSIGWATNPNDHKDINTIDPLTNAGNGTGNGTAADNSDGDGDADHHDRHTTGNRARHGAGADSDAGNGGADSDGASDVDGASDGASDVDGGGGAIPGQTELLDFLRTTATAAGTAQSPPATAWPPNQGPAPDWALPTTNQPARGPATRPVPNPAPARHTAGVPTPTGTNADADAGGSADASGDAGGPVPWPHLVNGINVPEPGSEQDLPGLDPIDPNSTDPAVQDRRTHGQKLLDGLIDSLKLAARTNKLPLNGGLKPQLFISTTQDDLERRTTAGKPGGIAFLPYSGPQPLALFEEELCDADVTTMILGNGHDILNVGRTQRLFTLAQRKILLARDMGCTFPDCTAPAYWCEAHHITPWQDGGQTNIDNGCLTCGLHHHIVHRGQWSIKLDNGVPWYTPAYSIDPTQRPRRNTYHHGLPKT